jgi:hypothetical protein
MRNCTRSAGAPAKFEGWLLAEPLPMSIRKEAIDPRRSNGRCHVMDPDADAMPLQACAYRVLIVCLSCAYRVLIVCLSSCCYRIKVTKRSEIHGIIL